MDTLELYALGEKQAYYAKLANLYAADGEYGTESQRRLAMMYMRIAQAIADCLNEEVAP